jgi:hypothetical protein
MQWRLPNISPKTVPENFSIWIYLLAFVISAVFFSCAVLLINGEFAFSNIKFTGLYFVIAPLLFSLSVMGFFYSFYYRQRIKVLFFNQCIKNKHENWQDWARESMVLLDSSYLTDIDNLALKIMGLEGNPPMNPNKVLPISALQNVNSSPLFFVFDHILSPMKAKINTLPNIKILLNASQSNSTLVNTLVNYCHLNHCNIKPENIIFSNKIPSPDIIHDWFDTGYCGTVLLINLIFDHSMPLAVTEHCCALLLSNSKDSLKYSRLRLFRPLKTQLTDLSDDLNYLLKAEQVEKRQVRQVWTTFLPNSALNILKSAFFDVESEIIIDPNKFYPLDLYLGKLDHTHVWLALVLAAEGVSHGQKGQIIAAQSGDDIHIMQLYDKSMQIAEDMPEDCVFFYPIVFLFSAIFCLFSIIALLPASRIEYSEVSLITTIGTILFVLITTITLYFKLLIYKDDFEDKWSRELSKIAYKN